MSESKKRKLIFDTDPGMGLPYADIDDNIALLFAMGCEELSVDLITIVQGNTPALAGLRSMEETLKYLDPEVPVSLGSQRPLFRPYCAGQDLGRRTLGPIDFGGLIEWDKDRHVRATALCDMAAQLEQSDAPVTIVAIGPLTNVALLLHQRPDLHERIESVLIMGGAVDRGGNITPFAEFNIWVDPDAAAMVFDAPVPKTLVGLDVTTMVEFFGEDFEPALEDLGNLDFTRYVRESVEGWLEVIRKRGGASAGFHPHDPIALSYLIQPDLFTTRQMRVSVDMRTGQTVGIPDSTGNTTVCTGLDSEGFKRLFFERFARAPLKK